MTQLTKNFSYDEMKCKCGACGGGVMNADFMQKLQAVRDAYGSPMTPKSGFRCEKRNEEEGGAKNSMHLFGRAADIECFSGVEKFKIMMIAIASGMNGIGIGNGFIHLDDREIQTIWSY